MSLSRPTAHAGIRYNCRALNVRRHVGRCITTGVEMGAVCRYGDPFGREKGSSDMLVGRFGQSAKLDPAEDFTRLTLDTIALTSMSYR